MHTTKDQLCYSIAKDLLWCYIAKGLIEFIAKA